MHSDLVYYRWFWTLIQSSCLRLTRFAGFLFHCLPFYRLLLLFISLRFLQRQITRQTEARNHTKTSWPPSLMSTELRFHQHNQYHHCRIGRSWGGHNWQANDIFQSRLSYVLLLSYQCFVSKAIRRELLLCQSWRCQLCILVPCRRWPPLSSFASHPLREEGQCRMESRISRCWKV